MKVNFMRLISLLIICVILAGMLPMGALAAAEAFTITMGDTDDNIVDVGDTVEVPVIVGHTAGNSNYNSFDMSFRYDSSVLELTSKTFSGMSVTVGNGTVRVLRYGNDLKVGSIAFTLTFKATNPGTATIKAVEAKVGIRETAQDKDASDAVILNDLDVVINGKYQIAVDANSGGTVSVSPKEAATGERVEIKITPKSGYRMKTLTVTDANGDNVAVSTDNNGKYSFVMPKGNVTIKVTFTAKSTATSDSSNPKTGDDFDLALTNVVAMTSLLALAVLMLNKKKFCQKKDR